MADGRWLTPQHHWLSTIFSAHRARLVYGVVDLVTDAIGKQVLVDTIGVPFDRVSTALDNPIIKASPAVWCLGKLLTHVLQKEPYFQIDNDFFFKKRLSPAMESARIVAESPEERSRKASRHYYETPYDWCQRNVKVVPSYWKPPQPRNSAVLAGIIGGNDLDLLHQYANDLLDLVKANPGIGGDIGTLLEQYSLKQLANSRQVEIATIFPSRDIEGAISVEDFHQRQMTQWASVLRRVASKYATPFDVVIPETIIRAVKIGLANVLKQPWATGFAVTGSVLIAGNAHPRDIDVILLVNDLAAWINAPRNFKTRRRAIDLDGNRKILDVFVSDTLAIPLMNLQMQSDGNCGVLHKSSLFNVRNVPEGVQVVDVPLPSNLLPRWESAPHLHLMGLKKRSADVLNVIERQVEKNCPAQYAALRDWMGKEWKEPSYGPSRESLGHPLRRYDV